MFLCIPQNSPAEATRSANTETFPGHYEDYNGVPVKFPLPVNHKHFWVQPVTKSAISFEDMCKQYPQHVQTTDHCPWGYAVYSESSWPEFVKENWDSSD